MIEALIENAFWQQVIRFLLGSSLLLLLAWALESSRLITRFDLRAYLWKAAILGSVLLLIPVSVPQTPVYYIQASDSLATPDAPDTTTATTQPDLTTTAITKGDILTFDIDSIHSGTAAKGLYVTITIRPT